MFCRGSGAGLEYKRVENSPYRGVVVKNNDPAGLQRIKVYIPELTNQPYDSWYEEFENININSIGKNIKTTWNDKETNGDFSDTDIFEEIAKNIPWAEPCSPILGESGSFRYYKDGKIATISDCNYVEGFESNNTKSPALSSGSFSPAFLYENYNTRLGDAFNNPLANYSINTNPFSFSYNPSKYVNKSKGVFGVPEVGSKVWVFHYSGDYNFPVYFGAVSKSHRDLILVNDTDNDNNIGAKTYSEFDN